jgi:hypothetical protein
MLTALPVDRQHHVTHRIVDINDDVGDECTQQLLAHAHIGRIPGSQEIVGQVCEGAWLNPYCRRTVGRLALLQIPHARSNAVSQFFSSRAAIRRLSGSHAHSDAQPGWPRSEPVVAPGRECGAGLLPLPVHPLCFKVASIASGSTARNNSRATAASTFGPPNVNEGRPQSVCGDYLDIHRGSDTTGEQFVHA